jgi:hypothetical protein
MVSTRIFDSSKQFALLIFCDDIIIKELRVRDCNFFLFTTEQVTCLVADRLFGKCAKTIEVINKIESTRTVFNFYSLISLSKRMCKISIDALGSWIGFYKLNGIKTIKIGFRKLERFMVKTFESFEVLL